MIGGFVVTGNGPQEVVVTAKGPSLAQFGIPTRCRIRSSSWSRFRRAGHRLQRQLGSAANAAQIQAERLRPEQPFEAAILITLPPGAYTAIVSGVNDTTGTAIIEVFAL
jgi:hypothetical protein